MATKSVEDVQVPLTLTTVQLDLDELRVVLFALENLVDGGFDESGVAADLLDQLT